jgi:hypothetical protein
LTELKLENNEKSIELKQKDDDIKALKEELGNAREKILSEKLKFREEKLDVLVQQLGINRGQVRNLMKTYRQLFRVHENYNQNNIDEAGDKTEDIKDGLLKKGVSVDNVQKLCQKCEKFAKLKADQDKLYKERFEARQEVSLYDKK